MTIMFNSVRCPHELWHHVPSWSPVEHVQSYGLTLHTTNVIRGDSLIQIGGGDFQGLFQEWHEWAL